MSVAMFLLQAGSRLHRAVHVWWRRIDAREQLDRLPARLLDDMGLEDRAIACEVRKPFWRPLGPVLGPADLEQQARPEPEVVPSRQDHLPAAVRPVATYSSVLLPWRS